LEAFQQVVERYLAGELPLAEAADSIVALGFGEAFAIGADEPVDLDSPEMQPARELLEAVHAVQRRTAEAEDR
jgi:hypothetical protein